MRKVSPLTKHWNTLVIIADDLNTWAGCMDGHPDVKTPNIDRLAQRGVLFTNAHCPSPLCGPSRQSLLTDLLPTTTGVYAREVWQTIDRRRMR